MKFNLKSIVRITAWYIHFRSIIKVCLWWLWFRRDRIFFIFEGREYTYGEVYRESVRFQNLYLSERKKMVDAGKLSKKERLSLGIYMENTPEYVFASFAAGLSNSILFAINTGFRGDTLAQVINQANISHLIINSSTAEEVGKALSSISVIGRYDVLYVGPENEAKENGFRSLESAVAEAQAKVPDRYRVPIDVFSPVLIIYTSGTTGLPKGVPCTHMKLFGAGMIVKMETHVTKNDRGYISMPLFHSNAWYVGILPLILAGGSFVLKRKFSASAFEADMLKHGVTYLNYVGQPLHYIIIALEKKYGSGDAVEKALAKHPRNKFRIAYGNGASAVDRKNILRYLGMEHIYEIYGSTEAVITTANKPGDPVESVGAAGTVVILDEEGNECKPGVVDENGRLVNYDEAVGEICKKADQDNLRFDGYFANANATGQKFRSGYYHSGDIGHIRLVKRKRYLYFNGRTDDWIRKDGENFSAENVLCYTRLLPCVDPGIAYGSPCDVADEKVMICIQLKKGETFDPNDTYAWFMNQQHESGMDTKWMPDYIRIIDTFPVTDTQKIIIRPYKKEHFNIETNPDMVVYYRERGDTTYHRLTQEKFSEIKECFAKCGRDSLLYLS